MRFGGGIMQRLEIEGGNRLSGEIQIQGAKNSALPLLAATILAQGETVFVNCPKLSDIYAACRILSYLGCKCKVSDESVTVNTSNLTNFEVPDELMREMRSSIIFLGAIIGRLGECKLSFPGGCELGPRPIDMHLSALRKMGITIKEEYGIFDCKVENELHGAKVSLPFPSVGATENIMLAAVLAKGETEIKNAAREPEIVDLANYLTRCGAKIFGAGESTITIVGVSHLSACRHEVMPDRIVATTYLSAAAITGGELLLNKVNINDIDAVIPVFEEMGCFIYPYANSIYINSKKMLKPVKMIRTMPYPAFPTDAQAIIMATLCKAKGTSVFVENIFESRFKHVSELAKMGADIKVEGKVAIVEGVDVLYGTNVSATDLRGGASLVIAGLAAKGNTTITNIKHIDRGYEDIEKVLSSVGAKIKRV